MTSGDAVFTCTPGTGDSPLSGKRVFILSWSVLISCLVNPRNVSSSPISSNLLSLILFLISSFLIASTTKAENFLLKSLEAVRTFEIGDNINEGGVLENLAELYIIKGEIERALEYYNLSSEIFYKFGYDDKNADLKFKVGKIFLEYMENNTEAINYFEEALNMYEIKGYIKEAAIVLNEIGDIYLNRGLKDLALKNYDNAKNHYKELHDENNVNLLNKKMKSITNNENSYLF